MSEANSAPAASEGQVPAEGAPASFDAEFAAFLNHSFDDPPEADSGATSSAPQDGESTPPAAPAAAGAEPTIETPPASQEQPSADTPAGKTTPVGAQPDPEIDPADLAAFSGLGQTPQQQQPPAQAPAAAAPGSPPASPDSPATGEDEPFAPFQPTFKLRPEMTAALFESEDPAVREQALVGLLASFGNAITQVVEQRIKEHHAPKFAETAAGTVMQRQAYQAVNQHFYGTYPELHDYIPAVQRAFQVITAKDPNAKYSPQLAEKVAKLAQQGLRAGGIAVEVKALAAPAAPAPATTTPPSRAPGNGFEAGGARPTLSNPNVMSPEQLLNDLSQF